MKKIKVMDLLNIIANEEYDRLPNKLKFRDEIYEYDEDFHDYSGVYDNLISYLIDDDVSNVNTEVEIIEDKQEKEMSIEDLEKCTELLKEVKKNIPNISKAIEEAFNNIINATIDVLNEMSDRDVD